MAGHWRHQQNLAGMRLAVTYLKLDQIAKALADEKADALKAEAREKADAAKAEAEEALKQKADELKGEATDKAKDALKGLFK